MRARTWLLGSGVIVLVGLSAWVLRGFVGFGGAPGNAEAQPVRPVPVTTGVVETKDFPIYRIGLGTVQAFNTVTVRVRVDGEVKKIAFREGQDVEAGDLLAIIDPRPYEAALRQAQADKARDEAQRTNARLDLERVSKLVIKDFATQQSVDTQKALVAQFEAAVAHDEAVIDNAEVQLGYTKITSPLTGRLGIRLIDQGNIVHAVDATGLVVVTQLQPIALIFMLPQQFLLEVAEAMRRGELTVLAFDQDNKVKLSEGHLELIDNQIDQSTGSMRLKAIFPNEDNRLWPGEFINAWLQIGVESGPVVPETVVQPGPNGDIAFVVKPDTSVEVRQVRVRDSHDGETLIQSGLAAGDRVVVDGHYRLRPGLRVVSVNGQRPGPPGSQGPSGGPPGAGKP